MATYGGAEGFRWLHRDPVPGRRANDAAVAPDGSLLFGTMRYDESPAATLSRITADGTVTPLLDDVAVSNGTGWSSDGRLMYYVDPRRRVDVFDVGDGPTPPQQASVGPARSKRARAGPTAHRPRRGLRLGGPLGRRSGPPLHTGMASWTGSCNSPSRAPPPAPSAART